MQSRRGSAVEVLTNTCAGFVGSWLISYAVLEMSPYSTVVNVNIMVVLCTVWSLIRGYMVRRMFAKQ